MRLPVLAVLAAFFLAACGSGRRPQLPDAHPPVAAAPEPQTTVPLAVPDHDTAIAALLANAERHFEAGRGELALGHLERARLEFDRAVEVLLESPYGARSEPRIRDYFDRLVDRISAVEMTTLAQGDGFTEKKYEAATIDELLEVSLFAGPATPWTISIVRADLERTPHDIPIPLNARVLSYVELFQGRLRPFIAEGLQRGTRYLPMIQGVFRAEGLPLDLAYVPLIESAFKPNALSRARAKGIWQFMHRTGLEYGLRHDWYIDERSDPEKATYAAARYLRALARMFDGDWHLALASYNGGPGRVQRAMNRSGRRDFWSLSQTAGFLPRETREYVPMILAAIIIARNPAQYGFDVLIDPPIEYDKVALPGAMDLRRVAEWTGASIDDIQALNPELRRWTTPVRYPGYEVKVPVGTAELLQARLESAAPAGLATLRWHTVRRGETLTSIARTLNVSRTDLAEANGLTLRSIIRIGQELMVPHAPATLLASRVDRPAPAADAVPASRRAASAGAERGPVIYRVRRGDTLTSIARQFGTTVTNIKTWNNLTGSRIIAGHRLTLFPARSSASD